MPRARSLKPGFFQNEALCELPPFARLLFAGLWTIADKAGRLEDRPKRIKAHVFPYDDVDVDELLWALHRANFIIRYQHEESKYIQVLTFTKHQTPHHREPESLIPAPGKPRASNGLGPEMPVPSRAVTLNLLPVTCNPEPDSPNLTPDSGNGNREPEAQPRLPLHAQELENLLGIFIALGRGLTVADRMRCENAWKALPISKKLSAYRFAVESLPEWRTRPTNKIAHPWTYLEGEHWERASPRLLPMTDAKSARIEQEMSQIKKTGTLFR